MDLIAEEPLSIRVQGRPYVVVMRTPGDELAHAAGLCLAEGLVNAPADIAQLAFCDGTDTNTVTVTLQANCARRLAHKGDRRAYISQTGCGLCGKELIQDLHTEIRPVADQRAVPISAAWTALSGLHHHQPLRAQTRAAQTVTNAPWQRRARQPWAAETAPVAASKPEAPPADVLAALIPPVQVNVQKPVQEQVLWFLYLSQIPFEPK